MKWVPQVSWERQHTSFLLLASTSSWATKHIICNHVGGEGIQKAFHRFHSSIINFVAHPKCQQKGDKSGHSTLAAETVFTSGRSSRAELEGKLGRLHSNFPLIMNQLRFWAMTHRRANFPSAQIDSDIRRRYQNNYVWWLPAMNQQWVEIWLWNNNWVH